MALFHRMACLSIGLLGMAASTSALANAPATSLYYGRWTVAAERPVFTARGKLYKTIDIAPCGKDFCGVSVADDGKCGPTLFRFLGKRARDDSDDYLRGHGLWGKVKKNIVIYSYTDDEATPVTRTLELYLGDGYDFGERSANMPKFHANYARKAAAICKAK